MNSSGAVDLSGLEVDDTEFQMALSALVYAGNKELPAALNKAGRDVALRTAEVCKKSDASAIEGMHQAIIANDKWRVFVYRAQQLRMLKKPIEPGKGWRKRALKELNRMMGRRKRAIGMLASAWVKVARAIERNGAGSLGYYKRGQDAAKGWAEPATATEGEIVCTLMVAYTNRTKTGAIDHSYSAFRRGLAVKTADMWQYVSQKMAEICQRYSAKG